MKNIYFTIIILFFLSCNNNKDKITEYNFETSGVFIANEGNFTYGNASLSYFDLSENKMYNNVFFNAMNLPLGDVAQSITIWEDKVYIAINNSGKVYVINKNTFKYLGKITELTSPRNILIINSEKAYISDLYSNNITIFNPTNFEKTGNILIGRSSEKMLLYNNFAYIVNWSFSNMIYKIDTQTDQVIDSLQVTYQPNSIVIDKNNKIWLLSDGGMSDNPEKQEIPTLTKINPENLEIEQVIAFNSIAHSPRNLCINSTKDTLFFLNGTWNKSTPTFHVGSPCTPTLQVSSSCTPTFQVGSPCTPTLRVGSLCTPTLRVRLKNNLESCGTKRKNNSESCGTKRKNNSESWGTNQSGIYAISITAEQIPETPFIQEIEQNFYALAISPSNIIYVSDAIDYTQQGIIYRYKNNTLLDTFRVEIIPGSFAFKK